MMKAEKRFQAHRGYWVEGLMENTLEALKAAKDRGHEMAEFDVRLTKDYVPVLYHDESMKRLHKAPVLLRSLTLAQARSFAPNLTTLEQVLTSVEVPNFLNIELKTGDVLDPALEIRVTQLVRRHQAAERVVLSSFNPLSLWRARGLAPEIARALLVSEEDVPQNHWYLKNMSLLSLCEPQFLHWEQQMATVERVREYRERGYEIAVYTVNAPEEAEKFFGWGVHSIISDRLP